MKQKRNDEEYKEQCLFVDWFHIRYPSIIINADMGGVRLSIRQAVRAKRAGHKKGYPDLFIAYPNLSQGYCGLYIEMKKKLGGVVSDEQKKVMNSLKEAGYCCIVCNGFDEAVKAVENYFFIMSKNND